MIIAACLVGVWLLIAIVQQQLSDAAAEVATRRAECAEYDAQMLREELRIARETICFKKSALRNADDVIGELCERLRQEDRQRIDWRAVEVRAYYHEN